MMELVEANWPWLLAALLLGLAVAWLIFAGNRKTRITRDETTVDGETGGTKRNQALIDAPPSAPRETGPDAPMPPATPMGVAGAGTAVAAAVEENEVDRAEDAVERAPAPVPGDSAPAHVEGGDDLTRIKGLGPKLAVRMGELGVTSFSQIAGWSDEDVARIDAQLGRFSGRIERDDWREQARLLQAGDMGAYQDKFGKL